MVRLDPPAGVKKQNGEAFAFRIEIRVCGHMKPPIFGGFVRGVAKLQRLRRGTFAERDDLVLVRLRVEFERFDQVVETGESLLRAES